MSCSEDIGDESEIQRLSAEAAQLAPLLQYCREEYDGHRITDFDFVGIFIVAYLAIRRPGNWLGGKTKFASSTYHSLQVSKIPMLVEMLDQSYLQRKLKVLVESLSVIEIFQSLTFPGLRNKDNYINKCMVEWAKGNRPCKLMFRIPSPMEVLRMQAAGERVVTMFNAVSDLSAKHISPLYYMDGMQNHAKDALDFLLHDLKHMENFVDPACHREQIGFFRCMNGLEQGHPRRFFAKECCYDDLLWKELEYVISDMNCFSPHLLLYTLAKMRLATKRKLQQNDSDGGNPCDCDSVVVEGVAPCSQALHQAIDESSSSMQREAEQTFSSIEPLYDDKSTSRDLVRLLLTKNWSSLLLRFGMQSGEPSDCLWLVSSLDPVGAQLVHGLNAEDALVDASILLPLAAAAYRVCMKMVDRMYQDPSLGGMTAEEGEVIRNFFISRAIR